MTQETDIIDDFLRAHPEMLIARRDYAIPDDDDRICYYDRKGDRLHNDEYLTATMKWGILHDNFEYQSLAKTYVGPYRISTVWLGLDHNWYGGGLPHIFETMVFGANGTNDDLDMKRYATEEQAHIGHERMVQQYRKRFEAELCER